MSDQAPIWKALDSIRVAMLVTHSRRGLHARPMSPIVDRDAGLIWFLTDRATSKACEIEADPEVALTFSDGSARHVAVAGTAAIVDDRETVRMLWNPSAQAFYPGGPDDADIVAIRVTPGRGEMWDMPPAPVALLRMGVALATGTSADGIGENVQAVMGPGQG